MMSSVILSSDTSRSFIEKFLVGFGADFNWYSKMFLVPRGYLSILHLLSGEGDFKLVVTLL